MQSLQTLPNGYREIFSVNLQQDKKKALVINIAGLAIILLLAISMHFYIPFQTLFDMSRGLGFYCIKFVIMIAAWIAYIVLHEIVHGIAMKICGTKKVKYGFTGMYAFAGSDDYYDKKSYIFIALAPVVFWGVIVAIINPFVPYEWFWVVYSVQIFNISGAVGDFYVTAKFLQMPQDILIKDIGVGMTVYSAK
jgi:hypothetical protein